VRRLPTALLLAAWPLAAWPESIVIRSGEHPGFSRLVLEFDERPSWSLRVAEGRARILLGPGTRSFDASTVFSRIPRTRIVAVVGTADGLDVQLGCDCTVSAFEVREAALAIDVSDPATAPEALRNVTSTASDGADGADTTAPPAAAPAPRPIGEPQPVSEPDPPVPWPEAPSAPDREAVAGLPPAPAPDQGPLGGSEPPRPADTVLSSLTEAIARATSQGNLRLATPAPEGAAPPAPAGADPAAGNIRLRLPGEEAWVPGAASEGLNCRNEASYDVAAWAPGERTAAEALAGARAGLAADLETIDETRAIDLARLYVSLGFGAEARSVLDALAPRHPEAALLAEMARIVDGEPPDPAMFETEAECPGRAQLWVALATGRSAKASDVIVAIGELPIALRRQLGSRVMSSLLVDGDEPSAEAVRGAIARAAGPHGTSFALAAAQMEARRDSDPDLAEIRGLVDEGSPSADSALAVLLEIARDRDEELDGETLARAETRADDLRGTDLGTRLDIGIIYGYLRASDFGRAASRLDRIVAAAALPPAESRAIVDDFFAALAARGTEEALLVHAARFDGVLSNLVRDAQSGAATAARLLDLGLPGLAERYLPEVTSGADTLVLGDRARLLSDDPAGALALLETTDPRDPDLMRLRAEALRALGRAEEAADILARLEGGMAGAEADPEPALPAAAVPDGSAEGASGSPRRVMTASEEARRLVDALLASAPAP
jgi:hypothetical protein